MNEKTSRHNVPYVSLLLLLVMFACFAAGGATNLYMLRRQAEIRARPLGIFWQTWELLEDNFYGPLPGAEQRTYGAIRGSLALLGDPYTIFLEPQSGEIERGRLAGAYGGIGVDLWWTTDGQVALSPYPDSPAAAAGVLPGDVLLAIDGQETDPGSLDGMQALLRGEIGTTVTLTLLRPPTPSFDLAVTRAEISIPSVTYRLLDRDPHIGYLHITTFSERTPDEASAALADLRDAGATQLLLDLRDNGGGLIQSAVDTVALLLDGGVVLIEVARNDDERVFTIPAGGMAADMPLVVLVNRSTASAAEIVAGAIRAHQRGPLVGDRTYGKGSVQLIYALSDGSSLHVTSAIWLLPDRQPLTTDGLAPDIPVEASAGAQDSVLERGIRYLQTGE